MRAPWMLLAAAVFAWASFAGCGRLEDGRLVGTAGPTLEGTITSTLPPTQHVHVTLGWLTADATGQVNLLQTLSAVSEDDVELAGSLPSRYQLPLLHPPPDAAYTDLGGGMRGAFATLFVYEDLNGNGRLDAFIAPEPSPDRVLSVYPSVENPLGPRIVFLQHPLPGFAAGYQQASFGQCCAPLGQVDLNADASLFDLLEICSSGTGLPTDCMCDSPRRVLGATTLDTTDKGGLAGVAVYACGASPAPASVTLNGVSLPGQDNQFNFSESTRSVITESDNVFHIHVADHDDVEVHSAAQLVTITSPAGGQTFAPGASLAVSWNASQPASGPFQLQLAGDPSWQTQTNANQVTVPIPAGLAGFAADLQISATSGRLLPNGWSETSSGSAQLPFNVSP